MSQVGGEEQAVAIDQIGAGRADRGDIGVGPGRPGKQGEARGADAQTGEAGGEQGEQEEDADAGVALRLIGQAALLEGALQPPHRLGQETERFAPPGQVAHRAPPLAAGGSAGRARPAAR